MKKTKLLSPLAKPWSGAVASTPTVVSLSPESTPREKEREHAQEVMMTPDVPKTQALKESKQTDTGSVETDHLNGDSPVSFQYTPPKLASKPSTERETDPRRLAQRQKQIDLGKNTMGYQNYIAAFPKRSSRNRSRTPDIHAAVSKRCFDGKIKAWRRALHKYDCLPGEENKIAIDLRGAFAKSANEEMMTTETAVVAGRDAAVEVIEDAEFGDEI